MNLFRQPKPRRFKHQNIYADDRKERLRQIEERARHELGMADADAEAVRKRMHDSFTANMHHLRKYENSRSPIGCLSMNIGIIVIILLVLLVVWRVLLVR